MASIAQMLCNPQAMAKLAANPETAPLLSDPSFMALLRQVQANPQSIGRFGIVQ
jgi:stress-induced-phosphoprotein 1